MTDITYIFFTDSNLDAQLKIEKNIRYIRTIVVIESDPQSYVSRGGWGSKFREQVADINNFTNKRDSSNYKERHKTSYHRAVFGCYLNDAMATSKITLSMKVHKCHSAFFYLYFSDHAPVGKC